MKSDLLVSPLGPLASPPDGTLDWTMTEDSWSTKAFGECASLVREQVSPTGLDGTPYIGLEHIGRGTLTVLGHGDAGDVSSAKNRFRKGDILFGKLRPYFRKVVRAPFDGICSTDIWVVRARPGMDQGFLYGLMASHAFVDSVSAASEGTKMPRAQWAHLERQSVRLPPAAVQRRVARMLGCLGDRIEQNRRTIETLDAVARTIFKDWFVGFGPTHGEMEGRRRYLPPDSAFLFPAAFVEATVGRIPEGWSVKRLGDSFGLTMGQSPPGSTYNTEGDGLPFLQGRADFGSRYAAPRRFCSAPARLAAPEDTLVSVRAPIGAVNIAGGRCCIGRGVAAVRHRSGSAAYTYHALCRLRPVLESFESTGTVFGAVTKKQFESLLVVEPPAEVVAAFDRVVGPLWGRIRGSLEASEKLAELRDVLVERLVSGRLRVDGGTEGPGPGTGEAGEQGAVDAAGPGRTMGAAPC